MEVQVRSTSVRAGLWMVLSVIAIVTFPPQ